MAALRLSSARLAAAGIALAVAAMLLVAYGAFDAFPHSADEYVYLYQARTLGAGRVTNPPLPDAAFHFTHVVGEADRTYGKYPPGWPAVLLLGEAVGAPFLVNPLLSGLALALVFALTRRLADGRAALAALALLATSPLVLLTGGSLYAHPLVAVLVLALAGCLLACARADPARPAAAGWLVGAAAALGGVALSRPFDAVVVGAVAAPFALALVWRRGRAGVLHAAVATGVLAAFVGVYLLYNAATTGDPFVPGHVRHDPTDRPAWVSYLYPGPTLRRLREYALFGLPLVLLPVAVWALWRRVPRGALAFAVALVAATWLAYAAYPIDPPPRPGPRYLYVQHYVVGMLLGAGVVAMLRRRWQWPLVVTVAVVQLATTGLVAAEIGGIVHAGNAVYAAADALEDALGDERAVVVLAGPSGSVPPQDLTRNDPAFERPVLFARQRVRGRTPWERMGLGDRRIYVWDGLGGAPTLWTPDPEAPVQQVVAFGPRTVVFRRGAETGGGAEPWLATFGAADCTPIPYASVLWRGLFPPDRLSDVQRPYEPRFGPCPGFAAVQRVADVGIPEALPRRRALNAHFRSFLVVREPGDYVFTLTGDERAVLRVAGVAVAEAEQSATRTTLLRLPAGAYPIAVSHFTSWRPPALRLRIEGPSEDAFALAASAPADARFHARLPASALRF